MTHPFLEALPGLGLASQAPVWRPLLAERLKRIAARDRKGRAYTELVAGLPGVVPSIIDLDRDWIRVGRREELAHDERASIDDGLRRLIPWRKGPFELFGVRLDSEWASYMKWNRLRPHLAGLSGRRVLDIGSSSGYYMFRMAAAAPELVVGIEPYLTFYFQFLFLQHFIGAERLFTLPLRLAEFPLLEGFFDTVVCMGILYHQRDPREALARIGRLLRPGGELVLETLIVESHQDDLLKPPGRYAKMNNVHAVPTVRRIERWLRQTGFGQTRCVDVTPTTPAEQRRTDWMPFESLTDFLDRNDPRLTVEGHPAPVRAMVMAVRDSF